MATQQASFYCNICQQQRLFTAQNQVNQVFYLILTLFSCGLFAIIWLIANLNYTPRYHCSQCGARPQFERVVREAKEPSGVAKWFYSLMDTFKATSFGAKFLSLHVVVKIIIGIFSFVFFIIVLGQLFQLATNGFKQPEMNVNRSSNSVANQEISSKGKIRYPAGMSPAENLEKGRKALDDGDQRTAWNHLFHIKKGAREFASAQQLLARIGEREKIEFELGALSEARHNLENSTT